jgi:hypothetical protein
MDTPVANGDPTLAALIPEGVTLNQRRAFHGGD